MKKNLFKIILYIQIVMGLLAASSTGFALTKSFNVINFKPAIGKSKYFTTYDNQFLFQKSFLLGTYFDYAYSPLEFTLASGNKLKFIQDFLVLDIYGTYALFDWWEIGLDVPIVLFNKYIDPITRIGSYKSSLSDLRLVSKFRLLNPELYKVGISLIPFIDIPTSIGDTYLTNGTPAGGALVVFDYSPVEYFSLALNTGYLTRARYTDQYGADIDDQFLYSLGLVGGPFRKFSAILEVAGSTDIDTFFKNSFKSPLEIRAGLSMALTKDFTLKVGGGRGLRGGAGDPSFRTFVGLSYEHTVQPQALEPSNLPAEYQAELNMALIAKILNQYRVFFTVGSYKISPRYYDQLDEITNLLLNNHELMLEINGYASAEGTNQFNQTLSSLRALEVENYLVKRGVAPDRLIPQGFGTANPIASNSTQEGREKNRRVEFSVR